MADMYDIGELKNNPEVLYNLAIAYSAVFDSVPLAPDNAEIWQVIRKLGNSLWGNLPPVVTIDLRPTD